MSRELRLYLQDIREHCDRVASFTRGMTAGAFVADTKTFQAVLFSLFVIGEAAKQVPPAWRDRYPADWRRIAGLRDVIAHGYFAPSNDVLWQIVRSRVPALRDLVESMLQDPTLPQLLSDA